MPWDQFLNQRNFDPRIVRFIHGKVDLGETNQMEARWEVIDLHYQWKDTKVDHSLFPCARCFAKFITDYSGM